MNWLNENNPIKRPPVRYFGGKWRIAPKIIAKFPPHMTYVEPFAGGASLLFRKVASQFECINDANHDVVNFFQVLRDREAELVRAIDLTPFSREELRLAHNLPTTDDPLEAARRFYVRSRQSFGSGEGRYSTGWRYQRNDRRGSSCVDEWNTLDQLHHAARRLKTVQLECDDALSIIQRWDTPDTLFYVDPPYPFETRHDTEQMYGHEMSDADHVVLASYLHGVEGMVILSSYPSDLYTRLYPDWSSFSFQTKTNDNHDATEILWLNPRATDLGRLPLFENLESESE